MIDDNREDNNNDDDDGAEEGNNFHFISVQSCVFLLLLSHM